jgi:GT2 family glycosyltransferase
VYAQDYDFILRAIDYGFVIENMPDTLVYYRSFVNMHSPVKRQRQLYLARHALKLHKERAGIGKELDRTVEKLNRISFRSNLLFSFSWSLRNKSLRKNLPKAASYILVFLSSLLHYEVLNASFKGFLYARSRK